MNADKHQNKAIVVSGCRPTGELTLGNYFGAVKNWVELQDSGKFNELYFFIADWHALTTAYEDPSGIKESAANMFLDCLACGLNPDISAIFAQSKMHEHAEFALLLSFITPLGWLERNPTYKEQLRELETREIQTHGFLGYPVLQAADILLYKASHVPVGEDQLPHLELTREIARRFNFLYKCDLMTEPLPIMSPMKKLPGIDGRKMSKSYGNAIYMFEDMKSISSKTMTMYTDPSKLRKDDPGHPEGCVVFSHHKLFSAHVDQRKTECEKGQVGCVACKKDLLSQMEKMLAPLAENSKKVRKEYKSIMYDVLESGAKKAGKTAARTLEQAKKNMGLG
ncbi:tryptophan--tRNA ligase [Elusimicrobiota bacterium]